MKSMVVDESLSVSFQSFVWRKFNYIMLHQQNEKSLQVYKRKIWKGCLKRVATVGKGEIKQTDYKNHRIFTLRCISKLIGTGQC